MANARTTRYSDKLLPSQEYFRNLYHEATPYEEALFTLVTSFSREFTASDFQLETSSKVAFEEMTTPPAQLALFSAVIQFLDVKTVLEIGTFIGHTTMQLCRMIGPEGRVTTIEIFEEFANIARGNFHRNGFDDRITLIQESAGQALSRLPPKSFDMIFVDGSKQDYLEYTRLAESLVTDRGVIVVDDVFFHGDALNAKPQTQKGLGCKDLLDHYREREDLGKLLLPVGNGILILFRRRR